MKVTRKNVCTGEINTIDLNITEEELKELEDPNGRNIQYVVPHLSPDDREFIISGILPGEWDKFVPKVEEV